MGLQGVTIPVFDLTEKQVQEMLGIMQTYFLNVTRDQFLTDLEEKDQVILLSEDGRVRGFSTQMRLQHNINGHQINVVFSGDTVIERSHWCSLALPLAFGGLMFSILAENPEAKLYWLLTSKGYKTYRFLPVFFRRFYPSIMNRTPTFEKELLCSFGRQKFGDRFDAESDIVRAREGAQCLRPGVADITTARRRDKHILFFEKANPDHARGDELVCIARFHENNLNPFILRQLRR